MFPSSPLSILCIDLPALCIFTIAKTSFMSHDDPCTLTAHSFTVHDLNFNAPFFLLATGRGMSCYLQM